MNTNETNPYALIESDKEYRWMNENSKLTLMNGYLLEGQTVDERVNIIANTAEKILNKPGFATKFVDYMKKGYFSLSSPIWSNFGTDRGLPISCFGSYIEDTMGDIMFAQSEVGMMSKFGGGASGYFGALRPRGSSIKDNGKSSGSVHFMKLFETLVDVVSQGSVRRGHFSPYLPVEHPDIEEFLRIGSEGDPIQKLTHGVTVTNKWLEEMIAGDSEKRDIWAKIIKMRSEKGYPYIMFTDNVNNGTVDVYKDKGMKIHASNMCFTGDTIVAVADGRNGVTIKQLAEESNGEIEFPVYTSYEREGGSKTIGKRNGGKMSLGGFEKPVIKNAVAFKNGTKKIIKVVLNNGDWFECTPDHRLALKDGGWVEAQHAKGKELASFYTYTPQNHGKYRYINTTSNFYKSQHRMIYEFFNGEIKDGYSLDHIENIRDKNNDFLSNLQLITKEEHLEKTTKERLGEENSVYRIKNKEQWKENLSISGSGIKNPNSSGISNKELIELGKKIKEMNGGEFDFNIYLSIREELGKKVPTFFSKYRFGGSFLEYSNYVNGLKEYNDEFEDQREYSYSNSDFSKDQERFSYIEEYFFDSEGEKGLFAVEIIDEGKEEDVYDLTVDDTHCFYIITGKEDDNYENSHGILVHNCAEIALPSSVDESFVCDLSSMNIIHYDEWKETDAVETLTYFLDAVMQEFIDKLEKLRDSDNREENLQFEFMRKAHKFAKRHRALGVGVIGYHSYFQSKMIAFEDPEAYEINKEIFSFIKEKTYKASKEMAEIYGEPEILKGYGRRNTTLMAIAPTTSSAFIMGTSQSIEPVWSNAYVKDMAKAKISIRNKELERLLSLKGHNTREVWKSIRENDGSVQHLDFLTQKEKNVFKTYVEINQYAIIDQAADRQKFIDQSQSINLMIDPSTPVKDINALYLDAWRQGVKSLYYAHSKSAAQSLSRKITCSGCEA